MDEEMPMDDETPMDEETPVEKYLVIDTRDPAANGRHYELAGCLADHGDDVTVYLVQNAVLAVRSGSASAPALRGVGGKARVVADELSLRARAVTEQERIEEVSSGTIDGLVDALVDEDRKVLWL